MMISRLPVANREDAKTLIDKIIRYDLHPKAGPWRARLGYVSDDEKDELDAEAILDSIRQGTEAGNEEREKRGWPTMNIVGWHEEPHYDENTNNLSWAIIA